MDVLLIESSPGIAATLQHRLIQDGHDVVSCNDPQGGPCRGVESTESCPLEHHVDLAVLARQRGAGASLNEMGSICALRHRVPTITLYPGDEFGPGASTEVAAGVVQREVEAGYVAAIRRQLGHIVGGINVGREHSRIHVTLTVAEVANAQAMSVIADRARQAVREHDHHTPVVDVSVVVGEPVID